MGSEIYGLPELLTASLSCSPAGKLPIIIRRMIGTRSSVPAAKRLRNVGNGTFVHMCSSVIPGMSGIVARTDFGTVEVIESHVFSDYIA